MLAPLFLLSLSLWGALTVWAFFIPARLAWALALGRALAIGAAFSTSALGVITLLAPAPVLLFWRTDPLSLGTSWLLDPLSGFFITLMGLSLIGTTLFSERYCQHFTGSQQKRLLGFMALFVLGMLMVFTANDRLTFLCAWELMTVACYVLIVGIEPLASNRKAGLLFLGIAHIGVLCIASSFFLLGQLSNPTAGLPVTTLANWAFILALIGFGAKAGLFPLHVWLPEAHPAAPSPISAVMSGVMLKTAIYGLIRLTFDFMPNQQQAWWGYALVTVGGISLLLGVIHAAMQSDMKRLLAYSSMENLGFIALCLGLAIVFNVNHLTTLAHLALLITLLHSLNHSLFKTLLFLATGSILHATGERNLGRLGGLIRTMPWVSSCALIGALSMAGLPLFNGFIGEWLYLHLFFANGLTSHFDWELLAPLLAAISILAFALAGFVAVKFFGIAFLGQPREATLRHPHARACHQFARMSQKPSIVEHRSTAYTLVCERRSADNRGFMAIIVELMTRPSHWLEKLGLAWLAALCVALGILPMLAFHAINPVINSLIPQSTLLLQPAAWGFTLNTLHFHAQLSPLLLLACLAIIGLCSAWILRHYAPLPLRRVAPWRCGFNAPQNATMQDTAEGFGQPFKQIFSYFIAEHGHIPKAYDPNPLYRSQVTERIWAVIYWPLLLAINKLARYTRLVQQGRLSIYLLFIGGTLLVLLCGVIW